MTEKYLIRDITDVIVAVKYNFKKYELTIGGKLRFRLFMEGLLEGYFGCLKYNDIIKTADNKGKFTVRIKPSTFYEKLRELRKANGIIIEQVNTLDRMFY